MAQTKITISKAITHKTPQGSFLKTEISIEISVEPISSDLLSASVAAISDRLDEDILNAHSNLIEDAYQTYQDNERVRM